MDLSILIKALTFLLDVVTLGSTYFVRKKQAEVGGRRKEDKTNEK